MSKKRIGISFTTTNLHHYLNWFTPEDLGNDLEIVELSFLKNNIAEIQGCAAFILTGGTDLEPGLYNGNKTYHNRPEAHQPERDLFEERIYRHAQLHKIPVLAICRGMQLVNVLHGGALIQDLDELNDTHRKENHIDKQHEVTVDPESLLYGITQTISGLINSAHHQAIPPGGIGGNLTASALAEDGTVEAMEFADKSDKAFLLCIQWHPERLTDKEQNPFSANIKKRFLEETRKDQ